MSHRSSSEQSKRASVSTNSSSHSTSPRRNIFSRILGKRSPLSLSTSSSVAGGPKREHHKSDVPKLNRNGSTKSNKSSKSRLSSDGFIDRDDDSIFSSDEELNQTDSDISSVYSNLRKSGSMSDLVQTSTSFDNHAGAMIDERLNDVFTKYSTTVTPWDGFKHESLVCPKYLKTARRNKGSPQILKRMFLAQEINDEGNHDSEADPSDDRESVLTAETSSNDISTTSLSKEIFVMQFSRDGKYLAVAGRNSVIKIYKVICSPLGRMEYNNYDEAHSKTPKKTKSEDNVYKYAPVFHQKPVRVFKGHKNSILSIDWSRNNFLISGSMDKTVKLWHVDRPDALSTFQHEDFVTTVNFHPTDDRFFLSGSLDNQIRLWSILERTVAFGRNLGDDMLITASSFTPDGEYCVVGGFNGHVMIMETKGLHILQLFDMKPRSLVPHHQKSGNKVTNIKIFDTGSPRHKDGYKKWAMLITTNDSKIRLVNGSSQKLVTRFKGITNTSSIEASLSDDSNYVLAGSEDHWCYIWENSNSIINNKIRLAIQELLNDGKHHINDLQQKHKKYYDLIHRNKLFKKLNLHQILEADDIQIVSNENSSYSSFHAHHSSVNAAIFAPNMTKKLLELSDDTIFDMVKRARHCDVYEEFKKTPITTEEEIDNGIAGFIIVTTDETGLIRVFRQDPAYQIRKTLLNIIKKKDSDCGGKKKGLSPTHSHANFKSKLHHKIKNNCLSPTPSSTSVPTLSTVNNHASVTSSGERPPIVPVFSSTKQDLRPALKSVSNAILDKQNGSFQVRTDKLIVEEALKNLDNQMPNIPRNGAITPDLEAHTSFPLMRTNSSRSSIPLVVSTNYDIAKDPEIIKFSTPVTTGPHKASRNMT